MSMEKKALQELCGAQVQLYRSRKNLTQEELARQLGTEQNYISQIESGRKMMSLAMLRKMSLALDVSADALLFEQRESAQRQNILKLLEGQPAKMLDGIEAMVRLCVAQFGQSEESAEK